MTNKERLIANNEKIKEIQETLNNKILAVVGGKEIELELPSELGTATAFYYVSPTDDKILFSTEVATSGVWIYTISTKTWVKAYDNHGEWHVFQQVTDTKWLIGGGRDSRSYKAGLLLYNAETDTVTQVYSTSNLWSRFCVIGKKCLIWVIGSQTGTGKGMLVYDSDDDSCVLAYSRGYSWDIIHSIGNDKTLFMGGGNPSYLVMYNHLTNTLTELLDTGSWRYVHQVNDTKYLLSNDSYTNGIYVYDSENDSCIQIYIDGNKWKYFQNVGNKCLISSDTSTYAGILVYNSVDNTCVKVYDTYHRWKYFHVINNKCLMSSNQSGSELLLYNSETDSITQLYGGSSWVNSQVIDNVCLISSDKSSPQGLFRYNSEDDSFVQVYDSGYCWRYFQVINNKCLISGSNSSPGGILVYNTENDSCTRIFTIGFGWSYFINIGTTWLISGNSSGGLYKYNPEDDSVVSTDISGYAWGYVQKVSDTKYLIVSVANGGGVVLFNSTNDMATIPFEKGYGYDKFTHDTDNNYYISGTNKTTAPYTLYYTEATDSITVKKYYLGEI